MMNVAVVDDDSSVRNGLRRLLRASGHHVQLFSSAEEFLAQCVGADCVILDVQLPGMSGIELERRLRGLGRATPIVFITAQDNSRAQELFRQARASWVRKPFDQGRLLDAINKATTDQGCARPVDPSPSGMPCAQDGKPTWISPEAELQPE